MDLLLAAASAEEIEQFTKDRSTELQNRKIFQLPTAVDTEFFAPVENPTELRRDYELQGDAVYFVCVGRLAKVKGIELLIDALKIFIESYGPATLIIVGDGEEASSLRRHAGETGLQDNVIFRGSVPPDQVRDLVNCADVCLVGSHTEGFSCAMVEQIACGKPLVSTNVSGAQEIICDGENGYIVDSRNPQLFAEAMVKALKLQDAAAKSRQAALEKYSEQAVWKTFISLLEPDGIAKKPPA
jgi:glycosyltransferase involved in cell wall biosynthesis